MKTFTRQAAQGDLLIRRIDAIPPNAEKVASEKGKFVVAHSETGHDHVIAERPNVSLYTTGDPMVSYLQVIQAEEEVEIILEHMRNLDTHEPIKIPPGNYEIRRQREHTPEGWRRVED
jgi:hypothetical protein